MATHQYSCLEDPVDRGAWWAAVHRVAQSWTRLKWLSMLACMHWRRKWQPTPIFLPGDSQGQRILVGCCLWGSRVGHDWSNLAAAAAARCKTAILHLIDHSRGPHSFYMHWETKKIHVTCLTAIFTLLWWSGTKPTSISKVCLYDFYYSHCYDYPRY